MKLVALSERWAHATHVAYEGTSDMTKRLTLALAPVRSVIRVIDDSKPPMTVEWAGVGTDAAGQKRSLSATDMTNGRIILNPLPIHERNDRALDIVTGFAMHEASHAKHSRDRYRDLVDRHNEPRFPPLRVSSYLWNLIEDPRVERETAAEWPGYASYFDLLLDYMWAGVDENIGRNAGLGDHNLTERLRAIYVACRFPGRFDAVLDRWASSRTPDMRAEGQWWQAWQRDYHDGVTDTVETLQRAMDRLALVPATKQEMDELATKEEEDRKAGESMREQLERLIKEGIGDLTNCILGGIYADRLTPAETEAVERLVREGLIEVQPIILAERGASNPPLRISKPTETLHSKVAYIGKPDPLIEALRTALVFRASKPRYDIKLLRRGVLDDEELYRFGMADHRVFSERIVEARPDVSLGLLVDLSGSMANGYKLGEAQRLAQLFVHALHDQEGVRLHVWGHTGDDGQDSADIYRLWEPGDPLSRLGLIDTLPHMNNYDGHAIAWCVRQLEGEVAPQKALIVLADGLPSGHGYGHEPAQAHVRRVTDRARRRGIPVIQIAIDHGLRIADQEAMFGRDVVPYEGAEQLPRQMTKVLARYA